MHVLVIHIGPVQDFIASAKKCRDLWFGSWVLSELARAAARGVVAAEGRDESDERKVLVFPGASINAKDRAVANKIVARIAKPPTDVAEEAERVMRARLSELRDRAFARVRQRGGEFRAEIAKQQVDDAFEFFWAATPEGAGEKAYTKALEEAERLLAAVKNTRVWEQPTWAAEGVPKSVLDGKREAVLKPERLCGVGVLKRFGMRDEDQADDGTTPERIPSTLHIASGPFRAGLKVVNAAGAWNKYREKLEGIDRKFVYRLSVAPRRDPITEYVDGTVFYDTRLAEALNEIGVNDANQAKAAMGALRNFLDDVQPKLGEPIPYYALLLGDGDRMGKVIHSLHTSDEHRELSEKLEVFASSTRNTVEQDHDGALIYAGGDDVLALVPLHKALACATKLAEDFAREMQQWKIEEDGQERSPTLSIGMVIVHQLFPLDEALELVRSAEKKAKAVPGKNALAIVVRKRGGEPVAVEGQWDIVDKRLESLRELHIRGAISTKAQYELMDLALRLDQPGELTETLREVRKAEAQRILGRKRKEGGGALLDDADRKTLEELHIFDDPARLGRELYVAALLAKAERQANPPPVDELQVSASEVPR